MVIGVDSGGMVLGGMKITMMGRSSVLGDRVEVSEVRRGGGKVRGKGYKVRVSGGVVREMGR
ncbi:hypothetical protein, partial [Paenibacillus xylanexedens]|uniref:hypothetical protein n=1 Tax=Paenibacillus xylanexedens TaxID=528191 RepID=UPI001C92C085